MMTEQKTGKAPAWPPRWLKAMTHKRPEIATLVIEMLRIGIRDGRVSAEDVHHVPVGNVNAFGAATKYLRGCGFTKGDAFAATRDKAAGHTLFRWVLTDPQQAERVLGDLAGRLCQLPAAADTGKQTHEQIFLNV